MSPLIEAIYTGDVATAEKLAEQGANIGLCNSNDCPILAALNSENPAMMIFVLANGGNPNQHLSNGWSILHEAFDLAIDVMIQNRLDEPPVGVMTIIDLLLKKGASLENKSERGKTPLESLNAYAGSQDSFERLKNFFRPHVPNIDELVHYERRLT